MTRSSYRTVFITAVLLVLATVGAYFGVQRTEAFVIAEREIRMLPEVRALGAPIDSRLHFTEYSVHSNDTNGGGNFSLDVRGPRGRGVIRVEMRKHLGEWSLKDYRFESLD